MPIMAIVGKLKNSGFLLFVFGILPREKGRISPLKYAGHIKRQRREGKRALFCEFFNFSTITIILIISPYKHSFRVLSLGRLLVDMPSYYTAEGLNSPKKRRDVKVWWQCRWPILEEALWIEMCLLSFPGQKQRTQIVHCGEIKRNLHVLLSSHNSSNVLIHFILIDVF